MLVIQREQHIQHLLWRAGFGPTSDILSQKPENPEKVLQKMFQDSSRYEPLTVTDRSAFAGIGDMKSLSPDERRALAKKLRQGLRTLNAAWIARMKQSKAQLRERMTFFLHDHFACRLNNVLFAQTQNNVLRKHALGKFGDLLTAISKDPGMLQFLNNQQNRKGHPNENFAREVLELFTMGRGNYSETDIQEAARAFTGWGFNREGEFVFRKRTHDTGQKTFLGKRGDFDGDDILRIILDQRQTATFLTGKFYRHFVNQEPDEEVIRDWSQAFFESEYDISALMEQIFLSDHFYESRNIGSQIKSPVLFLTGMMRLLDMEFESEDGPLLIQKALGQVLFVPPNVAGWPEGRDWIDSGTIMARMRLPQALIMASEFDFKTKDNFAMNEDVMQGGNRKFQQKIKARINWKPLMKEIEGKNDIEAIRCISEYLLLQQPKFVDENWMKQFVRGNTHEEQVKSLAMRLICTPEFQMG